MGSLFSNCCNDRNDPSNSIKLEQKSPRKFNAKDITENELKDIQSKWYFHIDTEKQSNADTAITSTKL